MRIIRSFCPSLADQRNWVKDDAERIENTGWDYKEILSFRDDIIQLDWDTAVSREQMFLFADFIKEEPDRCAVAPQYLYRQIDGVIQSKHWNVWYHEPGSDTTTLGELGQECKPGDPISNEFGFGMVYLPKKMIEDYIRAYPTIAFKDTSFSPWMRETGQTGRICWEAASAHLHYSMREVEDIINGLAVDHAA